MNRRLQIPGAAMALIVVLPASFSVAQEKTEEQRTQEYVRLALQEFQKKTELDRARQALEQHRSNANDAYDKLSELDERAKEHFRRIEQMLDNEDGKRLADNPSHVAQYLDIKTHPPLKLEEFEASRRTVNRVLESVRMEPDLVQADYVPNREDVKQIRRIYFWAEITLEHLAKQTASLDDMLRKTPANVDATKAPALRVAVAERTSLMDVLSSNAAVTADEITKVPAMRILVESATRGRIEEAETRAKVALDEARAENDRLKSQYEKRISDLEKETAAERNTIQIERDKAKAELADLKRQADAQLHAGTVKSEIKAKGTVDAAEHERKTAQAQSPEVKELLKPFTTPGYHRWRAGDTMDRQPVSLKALQAIGALDPSTQGLNKLLDIGLDKGDKERPRFGYAGAWSKLNPGQKEELKAIQNHLIELGEVMVELKMLAP